MGISRRVFLKACGACAALASSVYAQARLSWSSGPPLPVSLQEIYPAAFNGEIAIGGGFVKSDSGINVGPQGTLPSMLTLGFDGECSDITLCQQKPSYEVAAFR